MGPMSPALELFDFKLAKDEPATLLVYIYLFNSKLLFLHYQKYGAWLKRQRLVRGAKRQDALKNLLITQAV